MPPEHARDAVLDAIDAAHDDRAEPAQRRTRAVIVDAPLVIDAVADPGARGTAARQALAECPAPEPLLAPGHSAFEVMSGLRADANRPDHPLQDDGIAAALRDAESLEIELEAIPWTDVHRAWDLAQTSSLYSDAIYVAAAERRRTALLTSDARTERSGAPIQCEIRTVVPAESGATASTHGPAVAAL